jgi:hypothetical protein
LLVIPGPAAGRNPESVQVQVQVQVQAKPIPGSVAMKPRRPRNDQGVRFRRDEAAPAPE